MAAENPLPGWLEAIAVVLATVGGFFVWMRRRLISLVDEHAKRNREAVKVYADQNAKEHKEIADKIDTIGEHVQKDSDRLIRLDERQRGVLRRLNKIDGLGGPPGDDDSGG